METFGDDLLRLLKLNDLTQDSLSQWLSDLEADRSPSGIKESLRQARIKSLEAFQYPMISEIIQFFQVKNKVATASRLKSVFWAQCHRRGLIQDISASRDHLGLLAPLRFPSKNALSQQLQRWKKKISEGDYDLYRLSLAFYYGFTDSYMHAPVRRNIAIDLARAAITYGDYSDAYVIAKRFELAYMEHVQVHGKELRPKIMLKLEWANQADLVRACQIKATAISFILFFAPVTASARLFREAERVREGFLVRDLIDPNVAADLRTQFLTRHLRMLTRAYWSGSYDKPEREELFAEAVQLANLASPSKRDNKTFLAADTLARALALSATNDQELRRAVEWQLVGDSADEMMNEADGERSKLREYRRLVTNFILVCRRGHLGENPEVVEQTLKRMLARLVGVFGPDKMRHSKFTLFALRDFAFIDMHPRPVSEDRDELLERFMSGVEVERLTLETLATLDRRAAELTEVYFKVDPNDPEQIICLEHASR